MAILYNCNNIKNKKETGNIPIKKVTLNKTNSKDKIVTLKKINWDSIPIHKLPINSKSIKNEKLKLKKYCCFPKCNKKFELNALDLLFSNNTKYTTEANHYNNGHPSRKQGYFGLRLPDLNNNKVLLYTYYDNNASDYKSCTIEIQIFNPNNKLIDKKIIQDGLYYECGWSRYFSISESYYLKVKDHSYCTEINEEKEQLSDVIDKTYIFKITPTGKIKKQ